MTREADLIKPFPLQQVLRFIVVLAASLITLVALSMQTVQASHSIYTNTVYSRGSDHGYHNNVQLGSKTYVFSSGTPSGDGALPNLTSSNVQTNADRFISMTQDRLNNTGTGANATQDRIGAAFLINTMLGRQGTSFGSTNAGINAARSDFSVWEARLRSINDAGCVAWDANISYGSDGSRWWNSGYGRGAVDAGFFNQVGLDAQRSIEIRDYPAPGSTTCGSVVFQVRKNCGNPAGILGSLPSPDPYEFDIYSIDASDLINVDPSGSLTNPDFGATTNRRQVETNVSVSYGSQPDDYFEYRPRGSTTYQNTRPTSVTTTQAEINTGGQSAPRLRTTSGNGTNISNTPPLVISNASIDPSGLYPNLYYVTSRYEQGSAGDGSLGTSHQDNVAQFPSQSIITQSSATRILHFYYDCSDPTVAAEINAQYGDPCPIIEIGTCPSYDPYNTFAPLFPQLVDLPEGNQPSDREDSVRTSTINNGSVSAGSPSSWSTTSGGCPTCLSRTQEQERTYSQSRTGDRWAYYYVHEGVTRVNSVQDEHGQNTDYVGGDNGSVALDYRVHYDTYPYDPHTPEIDYDAEFDERRYSQTGSSSRTRDASRTRTQSRETIEDDDGNVTGYTLWSTDADSTGSWPSNPDNFISSASWSAWGNFSGDRGSYTVTDQVWGTSSLQTSGDTMPPCYPRQYTATVSINGGYPRLSPSRENPNRSELLATVTVQFNATDGPNSANNPMRVASRITNLPWQARAWTLRSGDTESNPPAPSDSSNPRTQPYSGTVSAIASTANLSINATTNIGTLTYDVIVASEDHNNSPNIAAGDQVCWDVTIGPSNGWVGSNDGSSSQDGLILTSAPYTSSGQATDAGCTNEVYDIPYVAVFGADVIAAQGLGREERCDPGDTTSSFISAAFDLSNFRGSGAQFAAQAMNTITNFSTAKMRTSPPSPMHGLAFANSGPSTPGNMPSHHCGIDHVERMPLEGTIPITDTSEPIRQIFQNNPGKRVFTHITNPPSNLTLEHPGVGVGLAGSLPPGQRLRNGQHRTLYVEGNVSIATNIDYRNNNWNNISAIPSFHLIVDGDIYIDPSVTRLDGIYFATGNIYTCANGFTPVSLGNVFNNCQEPLLVNGSFSANNIFFNRYADSSLRSGLQNEFPTRSGTNRRCLAISDERRVCAAETINFSPEIYLVEPALPPTTVPGQSQYESITTLPPVL